MIVSLSITRVEGGKWEREGGGKGKEKRKKGKKKEGEKGEKEERVKGGSRKKWGKGWDNSGRRKMEREVEVGDMCFTRLNISYTCTICSTDIPYA